jgi:multidrug efflux system membrane fusion protein
MLNRAALLLAAAFLLAAGDPPQASNSRPVRVSTIALVQPGASLTLSGTVQARTMADLAFRVAGKVVERQAEIGDHVRAGQVLAKLDPADLHLSEQAAQAALQAAEADAANTKTDLGRYDQLGRLSPAYLPSEYDRRVSAARMAAARLVQAERQVALAHDQSSYGSLVADADGVITALPVQVGQVVAAGQTVASLAHTDQTEIVVDVPENRLADIRAAGDVTVTLWAAPGVTLHGHVREVGALADPATRTFAVKVALSDTPPNLMALGMTASVRFATGGRPVAVLPATALADQGGRPAVWVLDPTAQRATLRPVTLAGYAADGSMVIASGLAPGDQVVTAGAGLIEPGMALTVWGGPAR